MAEELLPDLAGAMIDAMGVSDIGALHKQIDPKLALEAKQQLQKELDEAASEDQKERILSIRSSGGPAMRQAVKDYEDARRNLNTIRIPSQRIIPYGIQKAAKGLTRTFSKALGLRGSPAPSNSDSSPAASPTSFEILSPTDSFVRSRSTSPYLGRATSRSTSPQIGLSSPAAPEVKEISHQGMKQRLAEIALNEEKRKQENKERFQSDVERTKVQLAHEKWKKQEAKDAAVRKESEAQEAAKKQSNKLLEQQNAARFAQQAAAEQKRAADAARKQERQDEDKKRIDTILLTGDKFQKSIVRNEQQNKREQELRLRMSRLNLRPSLAEGQAEVKEVIQRKYPELYPPPRPKPETAGQARADLAAQTIRNLAAQNPYGRYMGLR